MNSRFTSKCTKLQQLDSLAGRILTATLEDAAALKTLSAAPASEVLQPGARRSLAVQHTNADLVGCAVRSIS